MTTEHDLAWFYPLSEYKFEWMNCEVEIYQQNRAHYIHDIVNVHGIVNVPIFWNGDIYMVDRPDRSSSEMEEKLLKYSTSNNSWSKVLIPCERSQDHVHTCLLYTSDAADE